MKNMMIVRLLTALAVIASEKAFIGAVSPPHCWDFNDTSEWVNNPSAVYTLDWKFTANNEYPNDANIPSFMPYLTTVTYTWLQDQDTPPAQGEIKTVVPNPVSLDYGDVLSITIFRHIIEGRENDSARPVLRFTQTNTIPQRTVDLIYSVWYDQWETLEALPCGLTTPSYTVCCEGGVYPCTGYLQIDGEVLIRDELLVVDKVELNGGCGKPTITPVGPCDCDFTGGDICTWEACGWINTAIVPTSLIPSPSPSGGDFMYIIDASGELFLTADISSSSSFSFYYYLVTSGTSSLTVEFVEKGNRPQLITTLKQTTSGWSNTGTLYLAGVCSSGSSCQGLIQISAQHEPGTILYAAVDGVRATLDACPVPGTLPGFCYETFNTNIDDWSVFDITDGWLWTGFTTSPDVPPSPTGTNFVYIHDTSAALFFPSTGSAITPYVEITPCTQLSLNYYLNGGITDSMTIYLEESIGVRTAIATFTTSVVGWRNSGSLSVYPHCTSYPCMGKIVIWTSDSVSTTLDAGIDDFILSGTVYDAVYCT